MHPCNMTRWRPECHRGGMEEQGSKRNPGGSGQDRSICQGSYCGDRSKRKVPTRPTPGQSPSSTRCLLTIRRVWPEGDLDLKLPVGIFDGGKWQEGVGCLGEVGYHSLCREKTVRDPCG
jgi:hypothetical protein